MPVDRSDPPPTFRSMDGRTGSMRSWLAAALALLSLPLAGMAATQPDWIDARLERIVPRERIGIPHCDAMVSSQRELARVRDTIRQILATGLARRDRCRELDDSLVVKSCLDSLTPLRKQLRVRRSDEQALMDSVQRHAGRCNPAAFKAWQEWQSIKSSADTTVAGQTDSVAPGSFDRLAEYEFASAWQQERIERARTGGRKPSTSAGIATFREHLRRYLNRKGAKNPSAQTYFLLAVLDHREGDDEQAMFRLRLIPARDSSTVWKAPVAMLYGQILAPTSPDSALALLATAFSDTSLAAPAHYLMAQIEERRGRPYEALRHLSAYLDLPLAPTPGTREQAILATARALVAMADPPYSIREVLETHLPAPASDTIGLAVARQLLSINAPKQCIEILSSFQVTFPGTRLGEEARMLLSQVRRNRPGIVVR